MIGKKTIKKTLDGFNISDYEGFGLKENPYYLEYAEGYKSFLNEKDESSCPYFFGSEKANWWLSGYKAGSYNYIELWSKFENIPIDNDDKIETSFHIFKKGSCRFEILHWFEDTFNVSVIDDLKLT